MQAVVVDHGGERPVARRVDVDHRPVIGSASERVGSPGRDGDAVGETNDEIVQTRIRRFRATNRVERDAIDIKAGNIV